MFKRTAQQAFPDGLERPEHKYAKLLKEQLEAGVSKEDALAKVQYETNKDILFGYLETGEFELFSTFYGLWCHPEASPMIFEGKGTLLHWAVKLEQLEFVKFILENENNQNILVVPEKKLINAVAWIKLDDFEEEYSDNEYYSPLHIAAYAGNLELVKLLVEQGAEIFLSAYGFNNLHAWTYEANLKCAWLLNRESDILKILPRNNNSSNFQLEPDVEDIRASHFCEYKQLEISTYLIGTTHPIAYCLGAHPIDMTLRHERGSIVEYLLNLALTHFENSSDPDVEEHRKVYLSLRLSSALDWLSFQFFPLLMGKGATLFYSPKWNTELEEYWIAENEHHIRFDDFLDKLKDSVNLLTISEQYKITRHLLGTLRIEEFSFEKLFSYIDSTHSFKALMGVTRASTVKLLEKLHHRTDQIIDLVALRQVIEYSITEPLNEKLVQLLLKHYLVLSGFELKDHEEKTELLVDIFFQAAAYCHISIMKQLLALQPKLIVATRKEGETILEVLAQAIIRYLDSTLMKAPESTFIQLNTVFPKALTEVDNLLSALMDTPEHHIQRDTMKTAFYKTLARYYSEKFPNRLTFAIIQDYLLPKVEPVNKLPPLANLPNIIRVAVWKHSFFQLIETIKELDENNTCSVVSKANTP